PMAQSYHRMIIASNEVPIWYNVTAAAASWIMLAGFFTFPGSFTSLKTSHTLENSHLVQAVANIPLLAIASVCYAIGAIGLCLLWSEFRTNYVPGLLNCISGLLAVLINVYSARDGTWSPTAWATLGIVLFSLTFMISTSCIYRVRLLKLS
ncbi:hypothetical protein M406DRAFT_250189, partial [Cryphonectria parasitica EP155]